MSPAAGSERARERLRDAVCGVHDDDVGPGHGHRRAAVRLEGGREGQREQCLAVLDGEVTFGGEAALVDGLGVLPATVEAQGVGADDDVHLGLVAEPVLLPETVRSSPERWAETPTKCGLPAEATGVNRKSATTAVIARCEDATHDGSLL